MKKLLIFFLGFMACFVQVMKAQVANNPYVYSLVLDKTMSMTGHGGTDIWADVQNYCYEWIDEVQESSTILLFTFDSNVYGPQKFTINSSSDKEKVKDAVRNIHVDGRHTWISYSLDKAIKYVYDNYPNSKYNRRLYLITDGKEEQPQADLASVLRNYGSWRGDFDYLYYVDLRELAPESTKHEIENTDGACIGTGFAKFLTIVPMFKVVNCVLGGSKVFEQHFLVDNDALFSEMSFDINIDSIKKVGNENEVINAAIAPSRNIRKQTFEKMEDGKYKIKFSIDFCNGPIRECDIHVSLFGHNKNDKILIFEPSGFVIQARNKPAPKVRVKGGGGWK